MRKEKRKECREDGRTEGRKDRMLVKRPEGRETEAKVLEGRKERRQAIG